MILRPHPILCIIPPHMLRQIAERGDPDQRQQALRTSAMSNQMRSQRAAHAISSVMAEPKAVAGKERIIYDAQNQSELPGRKIRGEGDPPTGDAAADEAYDGSGATYDLFSAVYGRNSIDGAGMRLDSTVHYQKGYDNAFWNGRQMVYGDGDEDLPEAQRLFNRFTIALDIIGHELAHGITQHEANLTYANQPGALNESFSDVFGSLVKQRALGHTADAADWIIGAGIFTANVRGQGLRSMKAPGSAYDDPVLGKDPQPAHMRDYKNIDYDNGGVHINSGIPNHAFYIVAREIGGYAWEKAGRIWYITLRDKLRSGATFQEAAQQTVQAAGELFGAGSLEQQAVRKGWSEVGIIVEEAARTGCALAPAVSLVRALVGSRK